LNLEFNDLTKATIRSIYVGLVQNFLQSRVLLASKSETINEISDHEINNIL